MHECRQTRILLKCGLILLRILTSTLDVIRLKKEGEDGDNNGVSKGD